MSRTGRVVIALLVVLAAGCAANPASTSGSRTLVEPQVLGVTETARHNDVDRPSQPTSSPSTTTQAPPPVSAPIVRACPAERASASPGSVSDALLDAAAHPGFEDLDVTISVWADGWGEVLAVNPDLQLAPASNQKILVALGAYSLLDLEAHLQTTIEQVDDALVLRSGGDPTLVLADIDSLAQQVASAGVRDASRLVIDVSTYTQGPRADGWLDWQIPAYVGPLSGLMIDNNRWSNAPEFVGAPDRANGERVAERLKAAGVSIGGVTVGWAPPGVVVAEHVSPTIGEMVNTMMQWSDNQHADLLMLELGRVSGRDGSLAGGAAAIEDVLRELCIEPLGVSDDGSGLSRGNQRSAREFQQMLRVLPDDLRAQLAADLPVGGRSGTLRTRFTADPDSVAAKTGTIIGGRSLTGYATIDSGRDVVFSIIVNGEAGAASDSLAAIDQLVTTILRLES